MSVSRVDRRRDISIAIRYVSVSFGLIMMSVVVLLYGSMEEEVSSRRMHTIQRSSTRNHEVCFCFFVSVFLCVLCRDSWREESNFAVVDVVALRTIMA